MTSGDKDMPLARLMAIAYRFFIEQLHVRLKDEGYKDVRPAFGFVLLAAREQGTTAKEIAVLMGMSKQAAAKLVDAMVKRRYLGRHENPRDARVTVLRLTKRGAALLQTVEHIYACLEKEWAETIGERALEAMRHDLSAAIRASYGGKIPAIRPTL